MKMFEICGTAMPSISWAPAEADVFLIKNKSRESPKPGRDLEAHHEYS